MKMAEALDATDEFEEKREFILSAAQILNFRGLVNEEILYTCCGSGQKYIHFILQLFPNIRTVFFTHLMDNSNVEHIILSKAELLDADIQDISKLSAYKEYFPYIISIDNLNWWKSTKNGFDVMYHLLKPGGSAAILFSINSPFEDCFKDLIENTDWKYTYLSKKMLFPKFPMRLSRDEYKLVIEDAGFTIVDCKEYYRISEFNSMVDFYRLCKNFIEPLQAYIPEELRLNFEVSFVENFIRLHGVSERGNRLMKSKILSIFIRKSPPLPASPGRRFSF